MTTTWVYRAQGFQSFGSRTNIWYLFQMLPIKTV